MKKSLLFVGFAFLLFPFGANSQCTTTNATSCVCETPGATDCDLLPDLKVGRPPLLVSGSNGVIEYSQSGNGVEDGRLRVSVTTPNIGHGPLEIRATNKFICGTDTIVGTAPATCPGTGLPPRQLIIQRVYRKVGNTMTYYDRDAGSMTYHSNHGHMHVDDWGVYTLRTATANPDPLTWPIIGTGAKLGFCLMDYGSCSTYNGHCTDSLDNTLLNGDFPNYGLGGGNYNCSSVIQGISSGYTDIYYQYLDGMYLNIPPGTCNGDYYIVVQIDPYNYFLEENENNNVIAVPYTLTKQVSSSNASITASSTGPICSSSSVTLSANSGTGYSYLWSTGATTSDISVSTAGSYLVTVTTPCGTATSPAYNVSLLDTPPVTTHASFCNQGSASLSANAGAGTINWYDSPVGGTLVGTGNVYVTPLVTSTTTYYAQASTTAAGFSGNSQPTANTIGGGGYFTGSQYQVFNVMQNLTLNSVKVYASSSTSTTVELRNSTGAILNTQVASIPAGESRITLNWSIPPGTGYRLTRTGSASLYRNNSGVSYPYTIANYISITGSSAGNDFYYFFYDWEITTPQQVCVSDRVPATVTINANPNVTLSPLSAVCQNDPSFSLTGGSPSGGAYSGAGVSANAFSPSVAGVGTHTITYEYTDGNACTSSASQSITVNNCGCNPPGLPGPILGLAKVCAGSTITYRVNNNPNVLSYNWVAPNNATIVSGQGTNEVEIAFSSSFTWGNICVYAINACGTSVARCKSLSKHVAQRPRNFIGELSGHCETTSGTLSIPPAYYALSYTWTLPPGATLIGGQGTTDITFTTDPGFISGQFCVTSNNGCMDSAPRCANVFARPSKTSITGPTSVCAGQTNVAYSVNPTYGADTYTWLVPSGSTIVSGQGTTSILVNFGSNVGKVGCTAKNDCGNRGTSTFTVDINCRLPQQNPIKVYPNPASDFVTIEFYSNSKGNSQIHLMDLSGRTVLVKEMESYEGMNNTGLDVSKFSKGVYMLSLIQNDAINRIKIVIE